MSSVTRRPGKGEKKSNLIQIGNRNEKDTKKTRPRGFRIRLGPFETAFLMILATAFLMYIVRISKMIIFPPTAERAISTTCTQGLRKVSVPTEPPRPLDQQSVSTEPPRPLDPQSVSTEPPPPLDQQHYLDIDFQGNNNVDMAYRMGDVFSNFIPTKFLEFYGFYYPNTLAHQYYQEVQDDAHGHRNLTALLHVIDRVMTGEGQEPPADYCQDKIEECKPDQCHDDWWGWNCRKTCKTCRMWQHLQDIQTPSKSELVVHLRLGDVLTDPKYHEVDSTMEELWNREEGFLAMVDNTMKKYNYNKHEFLELISQIPADVRHKIDKCTIVGAGFVTDAERANRNEEYKQLVFELFESELDCSVETFTTGNPDRDLLYMAFANYFIGALGGYARLAASLVTARRGRGHALNNRFNAYSMRPTQEWMDWSQVDYHPDPSLTTKLGYSWEHAISVSKSS